MPDTSTLVIGAGAGGKKPGRKVREECLIMLSSSASNCRSVKCSGSDRPSAECLL